MKHLSILFSTLFISLFYAQNAKPFQIYNQKGKTVKFEKMIDELSKYDVVLFGELHNSSIIHWLELRTEKALFERKGSKLILGAEMFERDNQKIVNEYLQGKITPKTLKDSARLWPNYTTDYRPLVDFARLNHIPFIATNIPRRYAAMVVKGGLQVLDTLSAKEHSYMMKLPVEVSMDTPGYREMTEMLKEHAGDRMLNFVQAQAVKDATMAESILKAWKPGDLFLHFEGDYHSAAFGGLYWYLKKSNPDLKIAVISVIESNNENLPLLKEGLTLTEFNLVVPNDQPTSY